MRRSFLTHTVAALFALTLMAGQASAASISEITYDVTGASFAGNVLSGPIGSGTATFSFLGSPVATPFTGSRSVHLQISLFGGGNTLSLGFSGLFSIVSLSPSYFLLSETSPTFNLTQGATGASSGIVIEVLGFAFDVTPAGTGNAYITLRYADPNGTGQVLAVLGNEVRTDVPEPAAGTLLGLGMLGLLGGTAGGRAAWSRRRSRG